jgi:hypothetical protein
VPATAGTEQASSPLSWISLRRCNMGVFQSRHITRGFARNVDQKSGENSYLTEASCTDPRARPKVHR